MLLPLVMLITWPLSGNNIPDLPESSPFGPRLKASEGFRYDFHRGVDIPTPLNTSCKAIADGVVRLSGSYSSFEDLVVQVRHTISSSLTLYATYLHMNNASIVKENDAVVAGQVIGLSGYSNESGFAHLHFEIRENGLNQKNCVNPWKYLPYIDTNNHSVSVSQIAALNLAETLFNITVNVQYQAKELDFKSVYLSMKDQSGGSVSWNESDVFSFGFDSLNFDFTPVVNGSSNITILDNPIVELKHLVISPYRYDGRTADYSIAGYNFTFFNVSVPASACTVVATAEDLQGNKQLSEKSLGKTTAVCLSSPTPTPTPSPNSAASHPKQSLLHLLVIVAALAAWQIELG